jgi:hypothetical protein
VVTTNPVGTGSSPGLLNFYGGLVDETGGTGAASVKLLNNGNMHANGMNIWGGGANAYAVHVDGTSSLQAEAIEAGPFIAQSPNCLLIDAGGKVMASQSMFRGAGVSPACITNNGTFYDQRGNRYRNGNGGTYSDIPWRSAFTRPHAVVR